MVSALIPTHNRPDLLLRALRSVLNQTYADLEAVIVIDGPDPATEAALKANVDPRVRVIALPQRVGGSDARNIGAKSARGKWVAFLDDDDEWLPEKIAKQLAAATASQHQYPIVSTEFLARSDSGDEVWPRNPPTLPLSEYLLRRDSLSYGDGIILTTTIFAPKELFDVCEFKHGLQKHQDWDWMLLCESQPGVGIEFLKEPLAVWYIPQNRASVSSSSDWKFSMRWVQGIRERVTDRAYAGFIASVVAPQASARHAWLAFFSLLWQMTVHGSPKRIDYIIYFGMWLPKSVRRRLARL